MLRLTHGPVMAGALMAATGSVGSVMAQPNALAVELVTAEARDTMDAVALTGIIEARESVDLGFYIAGRVTEVLAQEGDRVSRDQVLARLDSLQQEQELEIAEAGLLAARAAQAQARQAADRAKALLARGIGTRAAMESAIEALSAADGAVEQAESAVDQAQRAVENTVLKAPNDGIITRRDIEPGQIVPAAMPVFSLAEDRGLDAVFRSADLAQLDDLMGSEVPLTVINAPAVRMTGIVTEISPLVEADSGTVAVRLEVQDRDLDDKLLGAAVRGRLSIPGKRGVVVPASALSGIRDKAAVWVVHDGRANLAPVEILDFTDDAVVLSSGIDAGETVVGAGAHLLYPGRHVRPAQSVQ